MFASYPTVTELFRTEYFHLLREAVVGGDRPRRLFEAQTQRHRAWAPDTEFLNYHAGLMRKLEPYLPVAIDTSWLQRVKGRLTPVLKVPALFSVPLPVRATELLRSHFTAETGIRVRHILDRSHFVLGDKRYRTDQTPQGIAIFGEDSATIGSLAGLAHELGHALYETQTAGAGLRHQIASETEAQKIEKAVVDEALSDCPDLLAEWHTYLTQVDRLNFYFYVWEMSLVKAAPPVTQVFDEMTFDPSLMFLRETLVTATGYQMVYAAASWARYSA